MALTATDWQVTRSNGNIRYTGADHDGAANYVTVIELHRWLQSLQDDEAYVISSLDETDIIDTDGSARSTDNIITLQGIFNIDDYTGQFIYDGTINQGTGGSEVNYDGIVNFGNADVQLQIQQNGAVIHDDFWNQAGAGINPDSVSGISHRFMIKVRDAGADIDNRTLWGTTRTFGNTYAEFKINAAAAGNNVFALVDSNDLNNEKTPAAIAAMTAITNTEGYRTIDVENDGGTDRFYSEFNRDTQTINDLFERCKWIIKDPTAEASAAGGTPADYIVDNATIVAQNQGFLLGANPMIVNKVAVYLKKTLLPTGPITLQLWSLTGDQTTGTELAELEASETYEAALLTGTYQRIVFGFAEADLTERTAATDYMIKIIHPTADATNYVEVRGDSAGAYLGGRSQNSLLLAATSNLHFEAFTTPLFYGIPANLFRGVTHEIAITGIGGTWVEPEKVTWTGGSGQILAVDNTAGASTTKMWIQVLTGVAPTSGTLTGAGAATGTATGATARTIDTPFNGATTGSAIIGSYGYGVEYADLTQNDQLFALDDPAVSLSPPNVVTFTVNGAIAGDRLLVTEDDAGDINYNQHKLNGALTGVTTLVTIGGAGADEATNASDTPTTGTIRILRDSGRYSYHPYSAYTGTTFTITSHDFTTDPAADLNNVFISYFDGVADGTDTFQGTYRGSDRTMFVRLRDGGGTPIKTAETTGVLGTNGGSATVNRISDL